MATAPPPMCQQNTNFFIVYIRTPSLRENVLGADNTTWPALTSRYTVYWPGGCYIQQSLRSFFVNCPTVGVPRCGPNVSKRVELLQCGTIGQYDIFTSLCLFWNQLIENLVGMRERTSSEVIFQVWYL